MLIKSHTFGNERNAGRANGVSINAYMKYLPWIISEWQLRSIKPNDFANGSIIKALTKNRCGYLVGLSVQRHDAEAFVCYELNKWMWCIVVRIDMYDTQYECIIRSLRFTACLAKTFGGEPVFCQQKWINLEVETERTKWWWWSLKYTLGNVFYSRSRVVKIVTGAGAGMSAFGMGMNSTGCCDLFETKTEFQMEFIVIISEWSPAQRPIRIPKSGLNQNQKEMPFHGNLTQIHRNL